MTPPEEETAGMTRQEFLRGAGGWSAIVAALVTGNLANPEPAQAGGWLNRRTGGGWLNGGGGGWVNRSGPSWINGGGGWINRRW